MFLCISFISLYSWSFSGSSCSPSVRHSTWSSSNMLRWRRGNRWSSKLLLLLQQPPPHRPKGRDRPLCQDPTLDPLHQACTLEGHHHTTEDLLPTMELPLPTTEGPHLVLPCTLATPQWVTTQWPLTTQDRQVRDRKGREKEKKYGWQRRDYVIKLYMSAFVRKTIHINTIILKKLRSFFKNDNVM